MFLSLSKGFWVLGVILLLGSYKTEKKEYDLSCSAKVVFSGFIVAGLGGRCKEWNLYGFLELGGNAADGVAETLIFDVPKIDARTAEVEVAGVVCAIYCGRPIISASALNKEGAVIPISGIHEKTVCEKSV